MDVEDSLSFRIIKSAVYIVSFTIFGASIILYYISTVRYTFSTPSIMPSSIPCYSSFSPSLKTATMAYSFDFLVITSQPFVIAFIGLSMSFCVSNLDQVVTLFATIIIFISAIFYFVLRLIYYTIAVANCSIYWFCITPCTTTPSTGSPSKEFTISRVTDIILFLISGLAIIAIPILRSTRNALKNRALRGENIAGKFTLLDGKVSDNENE